MTNNLSTYYMQTDTKENLKLHYEWVRKCQQHPKGKRMRKKYLNEKINEITIEINSYLHKAEIFAKTKGTTKLNQLYINAVIEIFILLAKDLFTTKVKYQKELKFLRSKKKSNNNKITQSHIEQAKTVEIASLDLLQDIENQSGDRLKAICPFHNDTRPSLVIYKDTNTYHCFVCNEHGDVINLVQHIMKLNFIETVKYLLNM